MEIPNIVPFFWLRLPSLLSLWIKSCAAVCVVRVATPWRGYPLLPHIQLLPGFACTRCVWVCADACVRFCLCGWLCVCRCVCARTSVEKSSGLILWIRGCCHRAEMRARVNPKGLFSVTFRSTLVLDGDLTPRSSAFGKWGGGGRTSRTLRLRSKGVFFMSVLVVSFWAQRGK